METGEEYVARLQRMSPEQLAAEKQRQTARIDAAEVARFGYGKAAVREGRTLNMDQFTRNDSQPVTLLKSKTVRDQSGRPITTFSGPAGSIREWTAAFRTSGFLQDGILTGSEPADVEWLSQAASRKRAARDKASRGEK